MRIKKRPKVLKSGVFVYKFVYIVRKCLIFKRYCGERGTPGTSRYGSFQDYCNRPLYHLSSARIISKAGAKVVLLIELTKFLSNFFAYQF